MTQPLPEALAAYFAAKNRHDIDGMLLPFSDAAVVHDEGEEMRGLADIRAWMEETIRKYRVNVEVKDIARDGEICRVVALVSGSFPGSPAMLNYAFTLSGNRIGRLEIGA